VLIIVILLLIAAFAGVFMYGNYIEKQRNAELANLETPPVETEIYGDETLGIDPGVDEKLQGYRNILFLGTDVPDENGQRSDGNIIISINKETKNVKIFSIARDTFMEVVPGSLEKITHAYMHGGKDQTLWALNHTMDLNIREVVVFELDDVANVVDRVGGVEVELTDRELEFLNQMVGPDNQVPGTGTQLLNGKQAVMYSRMRKDVDKLSDFR
jgi:LCP family protein required for cell wall assembly